MSRLCGFLTNPSSLAELGATIDATGNITVEGDPFEDAKNAVELLKSFLT
jgi:hypothetical protein